MIDECCLVVDGNSQEATAKVFCRSRAHRHEGMDMSPVLTKATAVGDGVIELVLT